jgi:hypothetical protein
MDMDVVNDVLAENLELYDRAISGIRQCLPSFEKRCVEIISEISDCNSSDEAQGLFDDLLDVQGKLSGLLFGRRIDIGSKLEDLTREFDRLDDPYIRDYWFKKFKAGETWPKSS